MITSELFAAYWACPMKCYLRFTGLKCSENEYSAWYHLKRSEFQREVANKIKQRFERNHERLFTFLRYDRMPWNNNNAEHAIKSFARLRDVIAGSSTKKGIEEYLTLLSVAESCKYRGVDFLNSCVLAKQTSRHSRGLINQVAAGVNSASGRFFSPKGFRPAISGQDRPASSRVFLLRRAFRLFVRACDVRSLRKP